MGDWITFGPEPQAAMGNVGRKGSSMPAIFWKLWRGQYPLWVSFWGFYVVGYFVLSALSIHISPLFHTYPWRPISVVVLIVPYNVVSTVGLWRSAFAYVTSARGRLWPLAATVTVALWDLHIILSLERGFMRIIAQLSN
jgi:hypothetical protein